MSSQRLRFRDSPRRVELTQRIRGLSALLIICAGFLWARRHWFPSRANNEGLVVEVRGNVSKPGFYALQEPTLHEALITAGETTEGYVDAELNPGTRIVIDDGSVHLESMDELMVFSLPINVNQASEVALQTIPGIGATKAAAIVSDRVSFGPFSTIDDLERVHGIGPVTVDKMRPFVAVQ